MCFRLRISRKLPISLIAFFLLTGPLSFGQIASRDSLNRIFESVNSAYDEQNPVISPDGQTLYVTIANHPQNIAGKKDPGDIWYAIRSGSGWSSPMHAGPTLNNSAYNAVAGFSADGTQLYLLSHYTAKGEAPKTQGIAVTKKSSTGWSAPENIYLSYFLNRSSALHGLVQADIFLFSAESYNSRGAEDIYVSRKVGNEWLEPVNLGSAINTTFQELSPWFSNDLKTIYFSSNRPEGLGSFDIYSSTRLDDSWTLWSAPMNMGTLLNSEARELFYRKLNGYSIFTSTRNSDGYGDIHIISDSSKNIIVDSVKTEKAEIITKKNSTVWVSGRVVNGKTNEPIDKARLTFRAKQEIIVTASSDGSFSLEVPAHEAYIIQVGAKNYVSVLDKLDIHTFDLNRLEMNFKLLPVEVGATVNLKSVLFELGTTKLLEESYDELNVVVDFLRANPRVEIELEGHTDNRGDAKKNLKLSQMRVQQVKGYLVSKGISARRIRGRGFGGQRPIANSDSEEGRRLNRRVEFMITKN